MQELSLFGVYIGFVLLEVVFAGHAVNIEPILVVSGIVARYAPSCVIRELQILHRSGLG